MPCRGSSPFLLHVAPHDPGKTAIVGHSEQRSGETFDPGFLKCIDTFCHGGGWLTPREVHTGQVWQANQAGELRRAGGALSGQAQRGGDSLVH